MQTWINQSAHATDASYHSGLTKSTSASFSSSTGRRFMLQRWFMAASWGGLFAASVRGGGRGGQGSPLYFGYTGEQDLGLGWGLSGHRSELVQAQILRVCVRHASYQYV